MKSPKPPIPFVAQREIVMKYFVLEDCDVSKHMTLSVSVDHPLKPQTSGMFAYVRGLCYLGSQTVEPNPDGKGTLVREIRHIDLNGLFPEWLVSQITNWVPLGNYKAWNTKYKEVLGKK